MCRKLILLACLVAVLGLVDSAFGYARWRPRQVNEQNPDSNDFSDPNNWADQDSLYDGRMVLNRGPNYPNSVGGASRWNQPPYMTYTPDPCYTPINVRGPGYDSGTGPFYWYITGGFMHVSGPWAICYNDNTTGYTEMTGGELVFDGDIRCPRGDNNCSATVLLHGGTITADGMEFKEGGLFDFEAGGTLILDGDVTADVLGWVFAGYITAYSGEGTVVYDYNETNTGKTTISALYGHAAAWNPSPGYDAPDVCPDANLSWTPGDDADTHTIYFGASPNDVNVATADPCEEGYDSNSWKPPSLEFGTTYYWRIVEVNDTDKWAGGMCQFTVETGKARDPSPSDDMKAVPVDANRSWTSSCLADSENLYFRT
ncbi:MAG: hypothetical protein ACYTBZ_30755, partial [Planctomycetota bacterium]